MSSILQARSANAVKSGFLSILYSVDNKPLRMWTKKIGRGSIKRVSDDDLLSVAIELRAADFTSTFMVSPADARVSLNIKLPILVMILKNIDKPFAFDFQVMDNRNIRRRFYISSNLTLPTVTESGCCLPLILDEGWNLLQIDLADYTQRVFGTRYVEMLRFQVYANCRIRRIYFCKGLQQVSHGSNDRMFLNQDCSVSSASSCSSQGSLQTRVTRRPRINNRRQF